MERFINKTVVVTGASRSIGKAIAKRFAEEKANVILASNEDLVHEVAKEFKDLNYKCSSIVANVKNKKEVS